LSARGRRCQKVRCGISNPLWGIETTGTRAVEERVIRTLAGKKKCKATCHFVSAQSHQIGLTSYLRAYLKAVQEFWMLQERTNDDVYCCVKIVLSLRYRSELNIGSNLLRTEWPPQRETPEVFCERREALGIAGAFRSASYKFIALCRIGQCRGCSFFRHDLERANERVGDREFRVVIVKRRA
jgi:hypothetical protein